MLAARLSLLATTPVGTLSRLAVKPRTDFIRLLANDTKAGATRQSHAARRRTFREVAMAPAAGSAYSIGQGALAGAAVVGLGALAYYGLGMSGEVGALERSMVWPEHVRERIRNTYMYFAGSLGISAATAVGVFRTPALFNIVARSGFIALGVSIAALIGSGMMVRSIPYQEGFGAKQLAWIGHCMVLGAVVAPICLLGGPILTRAAWYTAGMVGGLSTVAATAPSEKFLYMGGPLAMGFGVILVASLASPFLNPATAIGSGIYSLALYGGLILFGGFILYDTQKIIYRAERHPLYGVQKFDPINNCIGIYADTVNIFIRIAQILAMGGGGRRK